MIQELFSLTGKVALVTGASSGLGRHFAKVLAEAGAQVVVGARRIDRLNELVTEIHSMNGSAIASQLDVTNQESIHALFEKTVESTGLIDIVVNCAGTAETGKFLEVEDSDWDKVFEVNVNGLRRVSQEATRRLIEAEHPGVIVNIASVAGIGAAPGWTAYATSKAAVIHLTKTMATELWKHGIRVNVLCPGYFPTEMNESFLSSEQGQKYVKRFPPKRTGELHELTGPLLLLSSDASSYMTGVALSVDGGHAIRLV
jgi:NAD(P)-dependent dehydrogenase (short-subunit alcohol dehydrogenase family)